MIGRNSIVKKLEKFQNTLQKIAYKIPYRYREIVIKLEKFTVF